MLKHTIYLYLISRKGAKFEKAVWADLGKSVSWVSLTKRKIGILVWEVAQTIEESAFFSS